MVYPSCGPPEAGTTAVAYDVLAVHEQEHKETGDVLTALRELGHDVRTAHTAAAGLDVQAAWPPDAAILDIGLPDMDGYALAAAMRRAARGPLRLAALTGYGRQAGVVAHTRADAAAFDLHLTKPASMEDLRRALGVDAELSVGLAGDARAG